MMMHSKLLHSAVELYCSLIDLVKTPESYAKLRLISICHFSVHKVSKTETQTKSILTQT